MIDIEKHQTIGQALFRAAQEYGPNPLIVVPANRERSYLPEGAELSYQQVAQDVRAWMDRYASAGYGVGKRAALFLENRPDQVIHKLALNAIGVCGVPVNPDYRAAELAYLMDHSRVDLIVSITSRLREIEDALALASHRPPVMLVDETNVSVPIHRQPAKDFLPESSTPASILYTSGTTGRPKGCVLSHRYELAAGAWYAARGGLVDIREGGERLYNPLPLFHVNASILSFFCMLLTGNAQVQSDRFHPQKWWTELRQTRATIVHYLGVIIPMLLDQPATPEDRQHHVRFGFGAGVEPQLHQVFEDRFGFPLLEIWGMTEMVRALVDNTPPRQVGTRAFGRAQPGVEARVVDQTDQDVANGTPGELLIRHSAKTPRQDFFSCYLDDEQATEHAWRGGWFHTGDVVIRDDTGMLHFFDRNKHIIRRSGENISAAEVEALLVAHPLVKTAAVLAVKDEVREEEVLACVVLNEIDGHPVDLGDHAGIARFARQLFDHCHANLAYYKAPAWMVILDSIPTTGTQKIQKHRIFPAGTDPRQTAGIIDFRHLKKRHTASRPSAST